MLADQDGPVCRAVEIAFEQFIIARRAEAPQACKVGGAPRDAGPNETTSARERRESLLRVRAFLIRLKDQSGGPFDHSCGERQSNLAPGSEDRRRVGIGGDTGGRRCCQRDGKRTAA
jgi:hypothetical protein